MVLIRDYFHCRPSELDEEPWWRINQILTCISAVETWG